MSTPAHSSDAKELCGGAHRFPLRGRPPESWYSPLTASVKMVPRWMNLYAPEPSAPDNRVRQRSVTVSGSP